MKKTVIFFLILSAQFFELTAANAAQTAKVITGMANAYDKPQENAAVVGAVPRDTSISVSNVPTNGFFKAKIPSGVVGWISGKDLLTAALPAATEAGKKPEPKAAILIDRKRIQVSAGLNILSNGGFPAGIPITGAGTGYGGTVEMQFRITDKFYWGGRAEYFLSSSTQIVSPNITQTLAFHTLPVMAGLMYVPISNSKFRLGVGGYAGFALMTSLTVTQTSVISGVATVTYASTDICEYVNVQGSYAVKKGLSILGEVGYQMHSATYPASSSLGVEAFSAAFGGLITRLGVEFRM